jgi:hypothetical protein
MGIDMEEYAQEIFRSLDISPLQGHVLNGIVGGKS